MEDWLVVHAFVDETKNSGLLVVAALTSPKNLTAARKVLRSQLIAGQRRIHFTKERDPRRRQICSAICGLDVEVLVYDATAIRNQAAARRQSLECLVEDLSKRGARELTIEQDDSLADSDKKTLYAAVRDHKIEDILRYEHKRPAEEPLLWIPDAVAWCLAKGGDWRRRVADVVVQTRTVG